MKKTIIILLAAFMTFSVSSAAVFTTTESSVLTDSKPKKQKAEVREVTFNVHLHCKNCVAKVYDNLSRMKGVKDLDVSLDDQTVYVKYDSSKASEQSIKEFIEKLGYPVTEHPHAHHE